jgi:hypothetical protein
MDIVNLLGEKGYATPDDVKRWMGDAFPMAIASSAGQKASG